VKPCHHLPVLLPGMAGITYRGGRESALALRVSASGCGFGLLDLSNSGTTGKSPESRQALR